jgi:alkyl hydroperoxide reductase subunit AhpC
MPGYQADLARFAALDTQVLGVSVDSIFSHEAWAESLGGISYPLLSDFWPHGEVAGRYGVLTDAGFTERVIFVIDKQGIIRHIDRHEIDETPDNELLLAILGKLT